MAFRDTIQDYKRAAQQRLQDARERMMPPTFDGNRSDAGHRHQRGAMYLAGYGVECLLKAYLIQLMNRQTLSQAMERLDQLRAGRGQKPLKNIARTAAGHQISYLVLLTDFEDSYYDYDPKLWGRLGKWQSSWRYESDFVDAEVAEDFLEDVEAATHWLLPKIGG